MERYILSDFDDCDDFDEGNQLSYERHHKTKTKIQKKKKKPKRTKGNYGENIKNFKTNKRQQCLADYCSSKVYNYKEHEPNQTQSKSSNSNVEKTRIPNYYPSIQGCRSIEEFQFLNRIEEGTYGVVYRGRNKRSDEIVALKRLKIQNEDEGFPQTSLREINMLLKVQHTNIVSIREIVIGSNLNDIYIVMDYIEQDIMSLMRTMTTRKEVFLPCEVKCLLQQLITAVKHLHHNWIMHRDLKPTNLLLSQQGILKVADFGMAREYGSPLQKYTSIVVTRWYRAPELLLCTSLYSTPIDIWSVGCIFAEFLLMAPYLPGKSDLDQLHCMFRELGTPSEKLWPGYRELPVVKNILSQNTGKFTQYSISNIGKRFKGKSSNAGIVLLQRLLTYDPKKRITADAALNHLYFEELPQPNVLGILQNRMGQHEKCFMSSTSDSKEIDADRKLSLKTGFSLKF